LLEKREYLFKVLRTYHFYKEGHSCSFFHFKERAMRLTFEKHKGIDLEEVVNKNPNYVIWLSENNVIAIPSGILNTAGKVKALDLPSK
jgi:hypothetical protein